MFVANSMINNICFGSGVLEHSGTFEYVSKFKDTYILYFVSSGNINIKINNDILSVKDGESFFVFPFTTVSLINPDDSYSCIKWVELKGFEVALVVSMINVSKKTPILGRMPIENLSEYFDIGELSDMPADVCRLNGKIMILLSFYLEYFPANNVCGMSYVDMAKIYIEKNYSNHSLSVGDIANYIKIDRTYLYRLFKSEANISVIDYITQCRMNKALDLLKDSTPSIKEVAVSVGFSDQMYFSRIFKKYFNKTPSEYRNSFATGFAEQLNI